MIWIDVDWYQLNSSEWYLWWAAMGRKHAIKQNGKTYVDMYMSHCVFGGRGFDSEKTCMRMPHCLVVSVLNQFRGKSLKQSRGHLVWCLCQENTGCLLFLLLFGFIMFQKKFFYRQPVEMLPEENRGTYDLLKTIGKSGDKTHPGMRSWSCL